VPHRDDYGCRHLHIVPEKATLHITVAVETHPL